MLYPFGLTMAGISSRAAGSIENKKKYNGIEFDNDLDINTYEAFYRNLDPQIGRWWQVDPKVNKMEAWSPYVAMFDDPIKHNDFLGDEPDPPGKNKPKDKPKPPPPASSIVVNTTSLTGIGLILLGQPITALKPIGALGSKPGSSIASVLLRNIPGKLTDLLGKEAGGFLAKIAGTNGAGAAFGRAIPYVGVILVGWSVAEPMGQANGVYTESNRLSGNWIANLPH